MFVCADTLATSPLLFPERSRDLTPSPLQLTSDCINEYYHLIYDRMPIAACHSLFGASPAPVASCLLLSLFALYRACTTEYDVGTRATVMSTSNSLQSISGLFPRRPSRSVDAIRTLSLALLVSSVAWLVPAR